MAPVEAAVADRQSIRCWETVERAAAVANAAVAWVRVHGVAADQHVGAVTVAANDTMANGSATVRRVAIRATTVAAGSLAADTIIPIRFGTVLNPCSDSDMVPATMAAWTGAARVHPVVRAVRPAGWAV